MEIKCVWEHNGNDTLLYAVDFVGAYTRGESLDAAKEKMPEEIKSYLKWCGGDLAAEINVVITEEKASEPVLHTRQRSGTAKHPTKISSTSC